MITTQEKVIRLFAKGFTLEEISEILGIPVDEVDTELEWSKWPPMPYSSGDMASQQDKQLEFPFVQESVRKDWRSLREHPFGDDI